MRDIALMSARIERLFLHGNALFRRRPRATDFVAALPPTYVAGPTAPHTCCGRLHSRRRLRFRIAETIRLALMDVAALLSRLRKEVAAWPADCIDFIMPFACRRDGGPFRRELTARPGSGREARFSIVLALIFSATALPPTTHFARHHASATATACRDE